MSPNRKASISIGILYLIGTLMGGAGQAIFWEAIHGAPDPLTAVSAEGIRVILGSVFWLVMGLALALIPVLAFPVLRKRSESLAVGYVVFRSALETMVYAVMAASWLLLIPLSGLYTAGAPDEGIMSAIGDWLLETRAISSCGTIFFCIGALMFYWAMFRYRLVPRWLSGWGLIAALPFMTGGVLGLVGAVDPWAQTVTFLDIPLALQEIALAVWLIVKGFRPAAE